MKIEKPYFRVRPTKVASVEDRSFVLSAVKCHSFCYLENRYALNIVVVRLQQNKNGKKVYEDIEGILQGNPVKGKDEKEM